jgi:hypothetical protein
LQKWILFFMTKDYASGSDKRCPTVKQFREIVAIFRYLGQPMSDRSC